jgi:hypothetical protein
MKELFSIEKKKEIFFLKKKINFYSNNEEYIYKKIKEDYENIFKNYSNVNPKILLTKGND